MASLVGILIKKSSPQVDQDMMAKTITFCKEKIIQHLGGDATEATGHSATEEFEIVFSEVISFKVTEI